MTKAIIGASKSKWIAKVKKKSKFNHFGEWTKCLCSAHRYRWDFTMLVFYHRHNPIAVFFIVVIFSPHFRSSHWPESDFTEHFRLQNAFAKITIPIFIAWHCPSPGIFSFVVSIWKSAKHLGYVCFLRPISLSLSMFVWLLRFHHNTLYFIIAMSVRSLIYWRFIFCINNFIVYFDTDDDCSVGKLCK